MVYRIDNGTAVTLLPTPAAVGPNPVGYFTKGNPGTGLAATVVDDDWLNMVQEEIIAVVAAANLTPDKTNRAQLLASIRILARIRLYTTLNLYVSATGNDTTNNGLTVGAPFLTMQKAWNLLVSSYDLNGFSANINVANGAYTSPTIFQGALVGVGGGNGVNLVGNITTPASVSVTTVNAHGFTISNGAALNIAGFAMTASGTVGTLGAIGAGCILVSQGNVSITGNMLFGSATSSHIYCVNAGLVNCYGVSYTINGGGLSHFQTSGNAVVNSVGCPITLTGSPAFSIGFAQTALGSTIQVSADTFTGTATGPRYNANLNGIINTFGAGVSYLPGNAVGVVAAGGQYV